MYSSDRTSYLADQILALVPKSAESPHYSEETFLRKLKIASQRESKHRPEAREEGPSYLWRQEWRMLMAESKLTARQRAVLELRLDGWTFEAIGNKYGHTKQGAQNVFRQAMVKVERVRRTHPYVGLSQTYRELIFRRNSRSN